MAIFKMIMKEVGGKLQNAAGTVNSNKNMYFGAKDCAPSDKLTKGLGGIGGMSGGTGLASNSLGGAGAGGAGDASSGIDFSSMGEAASAMA